MAACTVCSTVDSLGDEVTVLVTLTMGQQHLASVENHVCWARKLVPASAGAPDLLFSGLLVVCSNRGYTFHERHDP